MQHRVFGAMNQQRQTMALARAEHDQIAVVLARVAQDFALGAADLDAA
jgi:hypothetical protein